MAKEPTRRPEPHIKMELCLGENSLGLQYGFRSNRLGFALQAGEDKRVTFSQKVTESTSKNADQFFRKVDRAVSKISGAENVFEAFKELKNTMLKLLPESERNR